MLYIYFLEKKYYCSHSNRSSKFRTFPNIFWSCYNAYLDLENIVGTLNQIVCLKNSCISINKKKQFFLSHLTAINTTATNTTIFLSNISKLKHNQIIRIQTQKQNFKINQIITIKAKNKNKKDRRQKPFDPSGLCWGRRWAPV